MENHKTLVAYGITAKTVVRFILTLEGGCCAAMRLCPQEFDTSWNFDFTHIRDRCTFTRGGRQYTRLVGSKRSAIRVLGRHSSDSWLRDLYETPFQNKFSFRSSGWPVAYYGTTDPRAADIVRSGGLRLVVSLRSFTLQTKSRRIAYGKGIYCSPNLLVALRYADPFQFESCTYKLIIQV